jgi:hypothetical protein
MAKNANLVKTLCLPYCRYYKPGTNEELLCRGAVVVQRLMESDRSLSIPENPHQGIDGEYREVIMQQVCGACKFREQDCDFAQDRTACPCGGFALLLGLLKAGVITNEDLR